jgi:hypothetical protein
MSKPERERSCKVCGWRFVPHHWQQKYCSRACRPRRRLPSIGSSALMAAVTSVPQAGALVRWCVGRIES